MATDSTLDLALLKAKVKPKSYISFSKDEPKKRQPITAAGYPLGKYLSDDLKINDGKSVLIKPKTINKDTKRLWGMNRSLINNAIIGTSKGYEKTLELFGVGYRATLKGKKLNLQLGYSHDINFDIPEEIKIKVEKQTILKISGFDKQLVGLIASKIKSLRPPEPYKGKGIREKGQYVLRKEGKKK